MKPFSVWESTGNALRPSQLGYPRSTYVGNHAASRVDYMLTPTYSKDAIVNYEVMDALGIPSHSAVARQWR